jgi:hypothetical protein
VSTATASRSVTAVACREAVVTEEEETPAAVMSMKVYPNPALSSALLEFSLEEESAYEIRVINAQGKEMLLLSGTSQAGRNERQLNLDGMSQGLYIVQLLTNGQRRQLSLIRR